MDEYIKIGVWFGIPTGFLAWIGCFIYAISEYGWFLGTPLGCFIGAFFATIAGLIATFLWPVIAAGILYLIYNWNEIL